MLAVLFGGFGYISFPPAVFVPFSYAFFLPYDKINMEIFLFLCYNNLVTCVILTNFSNPITEQLSSRHLLPLFFYQSLGGRTLMYVHIGQDYMLPVRDIVSVFDLDTATWSKHTRSLIARLSDEGRVVTACEDLPKSAVLCDGTLGEILYISQLSPAVLARRIQNGTTGL